MLGVTDTEPNALVIVRPLSISESNIVSTNVTYSEYPAWSNTDTYASGDRVSVTATNAVYESAKADNTGNNPTDKNSLYWVRVGPVNKWAAFDSSVSTQTKNPNEIKFVIFPHSAVNCVALLNVNDAIEARVVMRSFNTDDSKIVYDKTIDLSTYSISASWWGFFYGQRFEQNQGLLLDLPNFAECRIELTVTGREKLAVGNIIIGQNEPFGKGIELGARVGIQDYSRKETNEFGDTVLVKRAFAKRANFDLMIGKGEVDPLQDYLARIRAEPVLWVGTKEYTSTVLFGFYRNFEIIISYPTYSMCELQIEGLT